MPGYVWRSCLMLALAPVADNARKGRNRAADSSCHGCGKGGVSRGGKLVGRSVILRFAVLSGSGLWLGVGLGIRLRVRIRFGLGLRVWVGAGLRIRVGTRIRVGAGTRIGIWIRVRAGLRCGFNRERFAHGVAMGGAVAYARIVIVRSLRLQVLKDRRGTESFSAGAPMPCSTRAYSIDPSSLPAETVAASSTRALSISFASTWMLRAARVTRTFRSSEMVSVLPANSQASCRVAACSPTARPALRRSYALRYCPGQSQGSARRLWSFPKSLHYRGSSR